MTLSASKLSSELQAVALTLGSASLSMAQAYGNYMKDAIALSPIIVLAIPTAVTAMANAMTFSAGASASQGAGVFAAGIAAFWGAMSAAPVAFFAAAVLIAPPPGISSLPDAMSGLLTANISQSVTKAQACDSLASAIHVSSIGGTTITPISVVTPIV